MDRVSIYIMITYIYNILFLRWNAYLHFFHIGYRVKTFKRINIYIFVNIRQMRYSVNTMLRRVVEIDNN